MTSDAGASSSGQRNTLATIGQMSARSIPHWRKWLLSIVLFRMQRLVSGSNRGSPGERAIELIDRVLATAAWDRPSHHRYRVDPLWDPVRDDPRFQAVLEKHGQGAG